MVEQLGPVGRVVGGAEDVHHHEVLDVVVLATLLQLVDVAAADALHLADHGQVDVGVVVGGRHDVRRAGERREDLEIKMEKNY